MIYLFTAKWCPQCKIMKPMIEELIKEGQEIEIIDAEEDPSLTEKYNVMSLPTMIKDIDGVVTTLHGLQTMDGVKEFIAE